VSTLDPAASPDRRDAEVKYQYGERTGDDALSAWLADHEPPPLQPDDREAIARLITPPQRTSYAA
jgi:hypothetical protein